MFCPSIFREIQCSTKEYICNTQYKPYIVFLLAPVYLQDIQGEVPSHLQRLKVEVERGRVGTVLEDCRAELDREMQALTNACSSDRVIKEHRVREMEGKRKQKSHTNLTCKKHVFPHAFQ